MATVLGEALVNVTADLSKLERELVGGVKEGMNRAENAVKSGGEEIERELARAGDEGGRKFSEGAKESISAGMVAVGTAAGQVLGTAFSAASDEVMGLIGDSFAQANLGDRFTAALGLPEGFAQDMADETASVFRDAWGESLSEVEQAMVTAQSSIGQFTEISAEGLGDITERAFQMADVFGVDVNESIAAAGSMMRQGLTDTGMEAIDALAAGMQRVPATIRDELFEASNEYSQFFASVGLSGNEMIGLLAEASRDGMYGIDKMGDAIKEFTIRATDMSSSTQDAFSTIGLDANDMANALLAGGDTARDAFGQIVEGLQGIDDPAAQAQAAIALFGTPLEDLGTAEIPQFLDSLVAANDEMLNTANVGDQMADATDTWGARFESLKRNALGGLADLLTDRVLPILDDFGEWWDENSESIAAAWENVQKVLSDAWNNVGKPVFDVLAEVVRGVADVFVELWPQIQTSMQQIFSTISSVVELIRVLWDTFGENIMERIRIVFEYVLNTIQNVMTIVQGIINLVLALIRGDWGAAWDAIKQIFEGVWNQIRDYITMVTDTIRNVIDTFVTLLTTIFGGLWETVVGIFTGMWDAVTSGIASFVTAAAAKISSWVTAVVGFIASLPGRALTAISSLVGNIVNTVTTMATQAQAKVVQWVTDAVSFLAGLPGKAFNALANLGSQVLSRVNSMRTTAQNAVTGWVGDAVSFIGGLPQKAFNALGTLGSKIGSQLTSAFSSAYNTVVTKIGDIVSYIGGLPQKVFDAIANLGSEMISGLGSLLKSAWNSVIDAAPSFHVRIDPPGPGVLFDEHISLDFLKMARGGVIDREGFFMGAEGNRPEAVVPLTRPADALQVMRETGLDKLALAGRGGPAVAIANANFYDGTDAELVAHRTMAAMAVA